MAKIPVLIALLLQLCTIVLGLSPCSEYYKYIPKPGTNEVLGQIEIPSPFPPKNGRFHLRVGLSTNPLLHTKYPTVRLELAQSAEEYVRAIQQDESLLYHLHFTTDQPIPKLTKIWFNDRQYCPGPEEAENITTTVLLEIEHPLSSDEKSPSFISQPNSPSYENSSPSRLSTIIFSEINNNVLPRTVQIKRAAQSNNNNSNDNSNNNSECGISSNSGDTNPLIFNGEETLSSSWLVALFSMRRAYEFRCAGSVLTTKHIITVAHCLYLNADIIPPNVLMAVLGRINLHQWRQRESVIREVISYTIHPDYTHGSTGDSDLAILTLNSPVEYSPFIKPICLWTGSTNLENIVNRMGYVMGWELNYANTEGPRMARVPIVSQEDCLRSDPAFVTLSSNRTFCAGLRNETNPCYISGSGLMLFDNTTGRYQLRGVVSRGVFNYDQLCGENYIVYVDVAKYIPWIQQQIATTSFAKPLR